MRNGLYNVNKNISRIRRNSAILFRQLVAEGTLKNGHACALAGRSNDVLSSPIMSCLINLNNTGAFVCAATCADTVVIDSPAGLGAGSRLGFYELHVMTECIGVSTGSGLCPLVAILIVADELVDVAGKALRSAGSLGSADNDLVINGVAVVPAIVIEQLT